MTDLLLITTLDVAGRQNNREHHAIAGLRAGYDHVTVVFRRRGPVGRGLAGLLTSAVDIETRDGVTFVGVDPRLNPADGAVRRQLHTIGRPPPFRRLLGRGIDALGILRDRMTIGALTGAARARLRTPDTHCEAFGPWAARAAETLRDEGRLRRYVYIDRDYEPGFMATRLRRAWAAGMERRATAQADLTLSAGHRLAARFADVPGANVAISPTGVDLARFAATPRTAPAPDLIFVGEIAPWSGIEELLEALARLRAAHRGLRLTILGPALPAYRAALEARIAALDLTAAVDWPGQVPRAEAIARLCRAGIGLAVFRPHPLRTHAAPLKIMEYMAAGLPVIALRGSEAGDMVTRLGTGLTCAATPDDIAAAIRRMLADPARFRRFSAAGPQAMAAYDWPAIMAREKARLEALYAAPADGIEARHG